MTAEMRAPWRTRFAAVHPAGYLGLHGLGGAALVGLLLWAFAQIADAMTERGRLVHVDAHIARWLQVHGTEQGEAIFSIVSWIGAPVLTAVLVVAAIVFARNGDWTRAVMMLVAGGGGAALNIALKAIFHRGRPEYASEFITGTSWSFPSGHAMDSLVGYGLLTYFLLENKRPSWQGYVLIAVTCIVVGFVGFSRIYLGVHYVSDVVAGFLAGAVWLFVCLEAYWFTTRRARRAPVGPKSR